MKISLKTTILIICIAITGVIGYQFYWLNNLYSDSKDKLDINIRSAMKSADLGELKMRIKILEDDPDKSGSISASAGFSGSGTAISNTQTSINETNSSNLSVHRQISYTDSTSLKDTAAAGGKESAPEIDVLFKDGGMMEKMLLKGFHQAIDNLVFPNVQHYDSLLTKELEDFGVNKIHYVDLIKFPGDSIISTSSQDSSLIREKGMIAFDYPFGSRDEYNYRLWIDNPNSAVLKQMAGILTASLLVLLLLGWLFYYLMHTIWRQKTLEEMKSDFINNMTHEFKTPLSVSYAAVDSLLVTDKANDKKHRDKYLNIAKDQINHLSGLVEQILSMSRNNRQRVEMVPEKIDLKEMSQSIARQQGLAAKKQIEFDIQTDPDELVVYFDRMHLANILNNLIGNSIKYSGESVKITIKSFYINGKDIQISVEDNGIGIDPEKQKNIFDKFYRVPTGNKHQVKGYGLGLFYVKETLERSGGSVYIKSKPGKGSVFTIYIPQ